MYLKFISLYYVVYFVGWDILEMIVLINYFLWIDVVSLRIFLFVVIVGKILFVYLIYFDIGELFIM